MWLVGGVRGKIDRMPSRRLAPLDGMRGVAVAAVLLFHAEVTWARGGFLGVDVFFVLSGFLITSLLLAELDRTGTIALGRFWNRRVRRLLPALGVLVVVGVLLAHLMAPLERIADVDSTMRSISGEGHNTPIHPYVPARHVALVRS